MSGSPASAKTPAVRRTSIHSADSKEKETKKKTPKWMKDGFKFMDSGEVQFFLGVLLMLSLFMADSWAVGNAPDNQNEIMYSILMFVVVVFTFEVVIMSIVAEGYFNSFFFWMDFLGTVSILLDIGWISDSFSSGQSVRRGSVLRATRAAKLGARYGRILRLMKLMKLAKMCPCLKSTIDEDMKAEPTLSAVVKISTELTSTISRRVAMLVVLTVIVVPFLSYSAIDFSPDAFMVLLRQQLKHNYCNQTQVDNIVHKFNTFYKHKDYKLVDVTYSSPWASCGGTHLANGTEIAGLTTTQTTLKFSTDRVRHDNELPYFYDYTVDGTEYPLAATVDGTVPSQWNALYGIILMILVIGILFGFSGSFHSSIETLVVAPLQKLMSTLRKSATIMIDSLKSLEKEKKQEEKKEHQASQQQQVRDKNGNLVTVNINEPGEDDEEDDDDEMEAAMLENLVEKLSTIVKHILPSSNEIVDMKNENVDKATADWLNQQYTTSNTAAVDTGLGDVVLHEVASEAEIERRRLATISVGKIIGNPNVLNSWEFDVLTIGTNEECVEVVHYLFDTTFDFFNEFSIPHDVFDNFLLALAGKYINTNTYHHFKHAVDVCHTSFRLMMVTEINTVATGGSGAMTSLEMMSLLVAALGHDVGHPAVNNGFLVKSKHALAFQHNDKSPLENMHCCVLYETLAKAENNIFANLTDSQWRDARKVILFSILGTDMAHHFDQVKKTALFNDLHNEDIGNYYRGDSTTMECLSGSGKSEFENRLFVIELVLHCSDISNPFKPFDVCAKWADLVMAEFFSQGDQERELGFDISPGFDRNTTNIYNMQLGFIEFIVAPLISAVIHIFPPLTDIGDNMTNNFESWGKKRIAEIATDPKMAEKTTEEKAAEIGKIEDRLKKFREKMSFLEDCKNFVADARHQKKALMPMEVSK